MHAFPPKQSSDMMRESSKNHLLKIVLLPNKHYTYGQNYLHFFDEKLFPFEMLILPNGYRVPKTILRNEITITQQLPIFDPHIKLHKMCLTIIKLICVICIFHLLSTKHYEGTCQTHFGFTKTASEMRSFSIIQKCTTFRTNRFALQGYQNFMTKNFRHTFLFVPLSYCCIGSSRNRQDS